MSGLCVIVGAGRGMGLSLARRFGREGCRIALMARRVTDLVDEMHALGDEIDVHALPADTSDAASVANAFAHLRRQLGEPDILIYNASASSPGLPSELKAEALVHDFRVNVVGALLCVEQVAPAMKQRGIGTILLTGGGLALRPNPDFAALSIGKAGLRSYALMLAEELTPHNIRVATVTIAGYIQPGTAFDPDRIADHYWRLHQEPALNSPVEFVYKGS